MFDLYYYISNLLKLNFKQPELVKDLVIVDISPLRTSPNLKHLLKCFEAMRLVKIDGKIPLSSARKSADGQLSKYITVGNFTESFLFPKEKVL